MRKLTLVGLAAIFSGVAATGAAALPVDITLGSPAVLTAVPVQLVCDPSRCVDPRTGAYTQSTCGRGGCRPLGGIVGYTNPGRGASGRPRYEERRRSYDDSDYEPRRGRYDRY
jgi:hypothetical protein